MRKMKRVLLFLLPGILWSFTAATDGFAQDAGKEVQAQLSLADGKTVYRTGEPIRLILSFTASADGYLLNTTTTKPASPVDEIILSPDAQVFHWLDKYSAGNRYVPDYASLTALSATQTRVELPLNDWFRFDQPGRFTVRVKTGRVSRRTGTDNGGWGKPVPLTTNEVSFEVKLMSDEEESQEVGRLSALLDGTRDWRAEGKITEELSYLTGDAATREKVRRFLNTDGRSGNYFQNVYLGLFIARNRALVVKLLESAFRDPAVEVSQQLINTLMSLRMLQEEAASPSSPAVDRKQEYRDAERRSDDIRQAYVRELAASLLKRTGKSRTTAAMTVLALLPKEQSEAQRMLTSVREILLQEFDQLHPFSQEYLLRVYWDQLRDPVLVPSLERMLAQNNMPQAQIIRSTTLKRLLELSKERARPFVIADIRDPASLVDFEALSALDDAVLPEVDKALLEQIKQYAPVKQGMDNTYLRHKTMLAARYASQAIYDELMETYRAWGSKWQPDARASLLAYFARNDEKRGLPLVEQAIADLQPGQDLTFFLELTHVYYSNGIDALLQKRLESDEPEAVSTAAYIMSKNGTAADKELIEARLNRWMNEWRGRVAELDADPKAGAQKMVQVNLIESLVRAKSWKLPDEQVRQLKQSCLTDACRQHFPTR